MNIFRWFLHHSVTNCSYFETEIVISAQVSQQSEKMQLIYFQTQLHSWNFQKMNHSAVCWHFQKIFALQCHKLCILVNKNEKCVSHQSEKTWPISFHIRSHSSKLSKNWLTQLSVDIFRWFLRHKVTNSSCFQTKNKMSAKVSSQSEQTQGTSFHLKVTHSKFLPVRENWQLHSPLTFSDGFCITESSFTHSVTQKSKSVQKCQNKLCRPRVSVIF